MATGRRPIETRKARWAIALAAFLARLGVAPNMISLASIGCAFVTFLGFAGGCYLTAAAGIQLRLICNLLDGMVAVEGGRRSPSGEIFNELPDRFSDILSLVGAGLAAGGPVGLTLGAAATIGSLLTAYVRALSTAAGAPPDFSGPMAKQHRMATLTAACLLCALFRGWSGLILTVALLVVTAGCSLTVARRTWRAIRALEG